MVANVELLDEASPLVLCVMPAVMNPGVVDAMATSFERLFQRGQRYALITCNRRGATGMLAKERRLVADWANQPRVREMSGKLCVGSATIIEGPVQRAALTAILWFWTPASPHQAAGNAIEAIDYCVARLEAAGLKMPMPRERLARTIAERMG